MEGFNTPILFLIFNRPGLTKTVFRRIKEIKPKYLFIAADGPRSSHPEDELKCRDSRKVVMDLIDWDCEVKTLFRDQNLGCAKAVSEAIKWFFEHVEEGIILEDDCYPDLSFFRFCREMLVHYKNDERVIQIGGTKLFKTEDEDNLVFTKYAHIWGWATWKSRWEHFINDHSIPNLKDSLLKLNLDNTEFQYWHAIFVKTYTNEIDSWDYKWQFTVFKLNKIIVLPPVNSVSNIGFGNESTHTKSNDSIFSNQEIKTIKFIDWANQELKLNEYYEKQLLKSLFGNKRNNLLIMKKLIMKTYGFLIGKKKYQRPSFSQTGEDLIIENIFNIRKVEKPYFLDIGANHPFKLNNTALFYTKGSAGINVEPNPSLYKLLCKYRPRDKNFNFGIGTNSTNMTFYEMEDHTLSTFDRYQFNKYCEEGLELKSKYNVSIIGINEFINSYITNKEIDLLNLDVEGLDIEIIDRFDFSSFSPNVICLETCEWSMHGTGKQNDKLIKKLLDHNYYLYANTHFNSIFIKEGF